MAKHAGTSGHIPQVASKATRRAKKGTTPRTGLLPLQKKGPLLGNTQSDRGFPQASKGT